MNIIEVIRLQHWLGPIFWTGVTLLAFGFMYCVVRLVWGKEK